MKARVFLRMAPTGRSFRYVATSKPSYQPIYDSHGNALPTIAFSLMLNLPAYAFEINSAGEVDVPLDAIQPAVEPELG